MTRLCERPGCSAPAEVAYGFDADHLAVWLDLPSAPGAARAGALCRRHADAMVVPRDWTLDDRREPVPQLFRPPRRAALDDGGEVHRPVPGEAAAAEPRRRRRRRPAADDTGQLAFDALAPVEPALADAPPAETQPADADHAEVEPAAARVGDEPVDATSPLDRPATPWRPVFDQRDDLHGLLRARGSLLSRAFRGAPRPDDTTD